MNAVKLLPMSTDPRGGWPLRGDVEPTPPSKPGESVRIESSFDGPKAFTSLRIGPDHRLWELGPRGLTRVTACGSWRVDEVTIDGVAIEHIVAALEAEAIVREDRQSRPPLPLNTYIWPSELVVYGAFGVGSRVVIRATNVGDTASYFYATWELEDVQ